MDGEPRTTYTQMPSLGHAVQAECGPEDKPGAVLLGFVIVSEWLDVDGNKTMTKVYADPRGRPPAPWTVMGWLEYAMEWTRRTIG